jgi:hypothetical protein
VSPRRKQEHRAKIRMGPSSDDVHAVVYFKRHPDDDPNESVPGREFLSKVCPPAVRATMRAALAAVASAPPKRFAGGGYWEAMSGEMTGWYEVRKDGPKRHHYRLFYLLDYEAQGQDKPLLVVVDGRDKPFRTELSRTDYAAVTALGEEYLRRNPRSLA